MAANRTQRRSASLRPPLRAEAANARGASLMTWRGTNKTPLPSVGARGGAPGGRTRGTEEERELERHGRR